MIQDGRSNRKINPGGVNGTGGVNEDQPGWGHPRCGHPYAVTHAAWVRERGDAALTVGLPLFVSEWGASDNTGGANGVLYLQEAEPLLQWVNNRGLSWINWSFTVKDEASAALRPHANLIGPWPDTDLTESGRFVKGLLVN